MTKLSLKKEKSGEMWLLNTRDVRCIEVQDYIIANPGTMISLKMLAEELKTSRYSVQQALEFLQNVYQYKYPNVSASFTFIDNNRAIQICYAQMISTELIKRELLQHSVKMNLLNLFFLEKYTAVNDILLETNISYTFLRTCIKEMNDYLAQLEIVISKKFVLEGNEINIRRLMFTIYYLDYDYATIPQLIDGRRNTVEALLDVDATFKGSEKWLPTRIKAYRIIQFIWSQRLQNEHLITDRVQYIDLNKLKDVESDVYSMVEHVYDSLHIKISANERQMGGVCALLIDTMFHNISPTVVHTMLTEAGEKRLAYIADIVEDEFYITFKKHLTDIELREIMDKLMFVNFQLLIDDTMMYPLIHKPTKFYVYTLSYRLSVSIGQRVLKDYAYDNSVILNPMIIEYMTVIHNFMIETQGKYLPTISIVIDMAELSNLHMEIKHMIENDVFIKPKIQESISNDTDLIISDTPLTDCDTLNIVWRKLPDDKDLGNFHEICVKLIQNKLT